MKLILLAWMASSAYAADDFAEARKAERRECVQCHSLRLIHSQRLSKAAWTKELDKMAGWGWTNKPESRQMLLEYLSAEYSDAKPVPQAPLSADGKQVR